VGSGDGAPGPEGFVGVGGSVGKGSDVVGSVSPLGPMIGAVVVVETGVGGVLGSPLQPDAATSTTLAKTDTAAADPRACMKSWYTLRAVRGGCNEASSFGLAFR
jgi:hypothetical protein